MGYKIELDAKVYDIKGNFFSDTFTEKHSNIESDGFSMNLKDVSSGNFHLIWGNHRAEKEKEMMIQFETPSIVSHFELSNSDQTAAKHTQTYHQRANSYVHELATQKQEYTFFEVLLSTSFFEKIVTEESAFLTNLYLAMGRDAATKYNTAITTEMLSHIIDMSGNEYSGTLKGLYLEAKVIELFLLQVKEYDQKGAARSSKLKAADIDSLQDARKYIDAHYDTPCSIIDLAKIVGINQMKLKNGFKELFGTTVFGYLRDLQMNKAKQLLLEEKLFVGEVADRIGYKHPHHFATAFKRKFGILPSELKK